MVKQKIIFRDQLCLTILISAACVLCLPLSAMAASISNISPTSGPISGGDTVTITGDFTKDFVDIDAGYEHTLALTSGGKLYAWGYNSRGQLGNGTTVSASTPTPVDMSGVLAGKRVVAIAAGNESNLVLTQDGKLYTWGYNKYGQLGNGTISDSHVPVAVDMSGVLAGKQIKQIDVGGFYNLVLTEDNSLYAWGRNDVGELGNGTTINSSVPVAVDMSGVLAGKTVTQISGGSSIAIALTSDGRVYTWGSNNIGQLGDGTMTDSSVPVAVDMSGAMAGKTVVQIDASNCFGYHMAVQTSDDRLYIWGYGGQGQLGNGTTEYDNPTPQAVDMTGVLAGKDMAKVVVGAYHTAALAGDGSVYSWGANWDNQLGDGTTDNSSVPVAVYMSNLLIPVPTVSFGSLMASSVTLVDANTLTAIVPENTSGTVDITIAFVNQPPETLANAYEYIAPTGAEGDSDDRLAATGVDLQQIITSGLASVVLSVGLALMSSKQKRKSIFKLN